MTGVDNFKQNFLRYSFLLSERFVPEFLFQLLSKDEYSDYRAVFFDHLLGTDSSFNSRNPGFEISLRVEHGSLGTVSLVAKSADDVILIEPLFYGVADKNRISRLVRILDTCYNDRLKRRVCILTLKHRLDQIKRNLKAGEERSLRGSDAGVIQFVLWDEILAAFRDLSGHLQRDSTATTDGGKKGLPQDTGL